MLGTARRRDLPMGMALRGYYRSERHDDPFIESHLDIRDAEGNVVPGYGWIFPMGDGRVNVGVGLLSTEARWKGVNTSHLMDAFVNYAPASWGLSPETSCGPPTGGKLPMGLSVGPRAGGNVLIAGDASGAINPFNGEGIAYGYETGRLAAAALGHAMTGAGASALDDYERELNAAYGPYYRVARAFVHLISHPEAMRLCVSLGMRSELLDERPAAHHGQPDAARRQRAGRGRLPGARAGLADVARVRRPGASRPPDRRPPAPVASGRRQCRTASTISVSPGQSQNSPSGEWARSSARRSASNAVAAGAEERRGRGRHGEEVGHDGVLVADVVGNPGCEDDPRLAEAGAAQRLLPALAGWAGRGTGPGSCAISRADLLVGNRRRSRARRPRSPLDRMADEDDGAARFERVVDGFGRDLAIGAVEGLPEGHRPAGRHVEPADLFCPALDPTDGGPSRRRGPPARLVEHLGLGVEPDDVGEEVGQRKREDTGPAAHVEQPPRAVEPELLAPGLGQVGRVGRPPAHVVGARCPRRRRPASGEQPQRTGRHPAQPVGLGALEALTQTPGRRNAHPVVERRRRRGRAVAAPSRRTVAMNVATGPVVRCPQSTRVRARSAGAGPAATVSQSMTTQRSSGVTSTLSG